MKIAVHQPSFLPWIGYWHKYLSADIFIHYAGIQYDDEYGNRVKMGGSYVTMPIQSGAKFVPMHEVQLVDPARSMRKTAKTIRQLYMTRKHVYRDRLLPIIEFFEDGDPSTLLALNMALHALVCKALGVQGTVVEHISRDELPDLDAMQKLDTLIDQYCPAPEALYLSGSGGRRYMTRDLRVPTVCQRLGGGQRDETILQLIATVEDPVTMIKEAGTWES